MKTGTLFLDEQAKVTLTRYLHDDSPELANASTRPAILVLPGGGYRVCSDREAEPVALAYLAEGFNTFVLRYTVGEAAIFPKPLTDAEKALETIFERAEEWRVDKARVAAIGFSAGGHLAAMLGVSGRVRPRALILGYPCILESMGSILQHPVPGAEKAVDAKTPPAFLFVTCEDGLVPVNNSLSFAAALDKAKVPFELHVFQKGVHGLSLAKPLTSGGVKNLVSPAAARWFGMSVDWLHGLWGDFPADAEQV
ncbi:MAG: alpha/beta hydrolase [Oscillospiraceae bacterium]|jgi:acetyl esterase/lipase|nr:alpha/beta hydrolase [Oscillospiraceae bacterium]